MGQLSAHAVRDIVIDRLASGAHPIGSKLPTSRELAAEIGAHRNTVAKAYQELANLGLVSVRQGRGTYVVAQAVFIVIKLVRGGDVNWFASLFTLSAVTGAGLVGGLLGKRMRAKGFRPSGTEGSG